MRGPQRLPDVVSNLLLVVALVVIWTLFAPIKLGGEFSYVLVDGTSMLPNFHTGDLAIVRQASDYQVGEVVTYKDAFSGAPIIHRIIGIQQNRFVMKGDNNAWIDPSQPTRTEMLGKLWLHLPKVGAALVWIRKPINLALSIALLGGLLMVTMTKQKSGMNGKKKKDATGNSDGIYGSFLYIFGFLGLVFLALAIFSFIRPAMTKAVNLSYKQIGNFAYSALGDPIVYDTGKAVSGEPVFTKLTCMVNLGFAYTLQGSNLENISGTQQIYAMLQEEGIGWKRTFPITEDVKFSGNTATRQFNLDLCQVTELENSVAQVTGVRLGSSTLVIVVHVAVSGNISGQKFSETFDPTLTFAFDGQLLALSGTSSSTDPLQTVKPGSLPNLRMIDATIKFLNLNPTVNQVRMVALIGLGICLGALLGLWIYFLVTSRRDPEAIIRMRYGALLINVSEHGLEYLSPIIDVASIEELARLAERQNAMIMHLTHDDVGYYLIKVDQMAYRYKIALGRQVKPVVDIVDTEQPI